MPVCAAEIVPELVMPPENAEIEMVAFFASAVPPSWMPLPL